jgi:alginate O-acetyltransferase complex protein AlgI
VVDIYEKRFPVTRSAATTSAYVLFFPHLIAGPILRPVELIPQLEHPRPALSARFAVGLAILSQGASVKFIYFDF